MSDKVVSLPNLDWLVFYLFFYLLIVNLLKSLEGAIRSLILMLFILNSTFQEDIEEWESDSTDHSRCSIHEAFPDQRADLID